MKSTFIARYLGKSLAIAFALLAIVGTGCISVSTVDYSLDNRSAAEAVSKFHELYNAKDFPAMYEMTDQRAREIKRKDDFIALFSGIRTEWGGVVSSAAVSTELTVKAAYREVRVTMKTKFERAEVTERFVWYAANGQSRLFSYEVDN